MGNLKVNRKAYTRTNGTKVKSTAYLTPDKGKPGFGPKIIPMPQGNMLGEGFFALSLPSQKSELKRKVKQHGNMQVQGFLQSISTLMGNTNKRVSKRAAELRKWVAENNKKMGGI
jgi:hypothetical protein